MVYATLHGSRLLCGYHDCRTVLRDDIFLAPETSEPLIEKDGAGFFLRCPGCGLSNRLVPRGDGHPRAYFAL